MSRTETPRDFPIGTEPGKPCTQCAARGRFTWLNDDGTCRRETDHA